VTSAFALV